MANEGSTGIVAIFAILLMVLIAGFIAWRANVFGGGDGELDVNINPPTEMR